MNPPSPPCEELGCQAAGASTRSSHDRERIDSTDVPYSRTLHVLQCTVLESSSVQLYTVEHMSTTEWLPEPAEDSTAIARTDPRGPPPRRLAPARPRIAGSDGRRAARAPRAEPAASFGDTHWQLLHESEAARRGGGGIGRGGRRSAPPSDIPRRCDHHRCWWRCCCCQGSC